MKSGMENFSNLYGLLLILFFPAVISLLQIINADSDIITSTQPLRPGNTIVSDGGRFELGFFSTGSSGNLYVGIWYKDLLPTRTIVFVLNRDNPVNNSSSSFVALEIDRDGNLVITDNSLIKLWTLNVTSSLNTVAQLLDSGNFVLRLANNVDPGGYKWQSFDHPTDTLLPGMKLGWDLKTGINRILTPWRAFDDPSSGDYSFKLNIDGSPEAFLWSNNKRKKIYGSGPWNGEGFNGVPGMKSTDVIKFVFDMNSTEVAYSFLLVNESLYSLLTVNPSGVLQRLTWIRNTGAWKVFWYAPADQCDNYKECGAYGICDTNSSPVCNCPKGFDPKNEQAWRLRDGSGGCERMEALNCRDDGFLLLNNMKMPDSSSAYVNEKMSLSECAMACRTDCLCMAYANMDIRGNGSGCIMWRGDLVDMRRYTALEGGQDLYLRVSVSVIDRSNKTGTGFQKQTDGKKKAQTILMVGFLVGFGGVLFAILACFAWKRSRRAQNSNITSHSRASRDRSQDMLFQGGGGGVTMSKREYSGENIEDELDLPLFDLGTITIATNNFSNANKLGQGGFGCVYKGLLVDGQTIAVKRLSKNSVQGNEEFMNEMRLIAKLQHRNLVRLIGCCIDMEEKMLIYEFMENKSLDCFIFNRGSGLLNWERRFHIICGIARGLLYLHQDSRFRIIHRDLKASNILLDKDMNPKISDFGMARIFGSDQTEANTCRVVGTYGYMSPEYAMDGLFSVKSDVFSFGVLVMEIVSGKKNRGFYYESQQLNLLGHAWRLWREGKAMELVDPSIGDSYLEQHELTRCIQLGLLCVQERAEDRPTMANVVLMLSSETTTLPQPKQPGFCMGRQGETSSSMMEESCTVNHVTVTILDGR